MFTNHNVDNLKIDLHSEKAFRNVKMSLINDPGTLPFQYVPETTSETKQKRF